MSNNPRYCGILIHPTSFHGPYGIGCFGAEAREMLSRLHDMGANIWQVLPLGPTGWGDSPYASRSTFAGNELLIDPRLMPYAKAGILGCCLPDGGPRIDYEKVRRYKMPVLLEAADDFISRSGSAEKAPFRDFCEANAWWLDDYALYQSLNDLHNDSRWFLWPRGEALRDPETLKKRTQTHKEAIMRHKALQYFFFKQWDELHQHAASLGIRIIGDIPIFVAPDSVDAWVGRRLFKVDAQGRPVKISGVPPDDFSDKGQLWGNPVYNWKEHEKDGFAWWRKRLGQTLKMVDIVRIDHFRGFEACWEVPAGAEDAVEGEWVKGPGKRLFDHFPPGLPIIAEDLGVITPEVEEIRDSCGFPGMKILQFGFDLSSGRFDPSNPYLPHNYPYNCAAYTGTHDNETSRGWFGNLSEPYKDAVRRYLECPDQDVVWQMVRVLMQSAAKYAIFPMQDIIGLGDEARMNLPATVGTSNWSWRLEEGRLEPWMERRFRQYADFYGRDGSCGGDGSSKKDGASSKDSSSKKDCSPAEKGSTTKGSRSGEDEHHTV